MMSTKGAANGKKIFLVDSGAHSDTNGDFSYTISGLTFSSGDIGVLWVAAKNADTSYSITGWTEIEPSGSSSREGSLWVREMDGTETQIVSSGAGDLSATRLIVAFWRGCSLPTGSDSSYATGSTDHPNPPATPYSVSPSDVVVVMGMQETFGGTTINSISSGYTVINNSSNGDTNTAMGYATGLTGSIDPGAFDTADDSTNNLAATLVLSRP